MQNGVQTAGIDLSQKIEEEKNKTARERYQSALHAQGTSHSIHIELAKEKLRGILASTGFNEFLDKSSKMLERVFKLV
jgi:hypothetical protein